MTEKSSASKILKRSFGLTLKERKVATNRMHIKLKEENGDIAKTSRRPEILADFFEKKQWGQTKPDNNEHEWPNQKIFPFSDMVLKHVNS